MIRVLCSLGLLVALFVTTAAEAEAQVDHFFYVPGIAGESLDADHADWIDLTSFRQVLRPAGASAVLCRVELFKRLDAASPGLWAAAAANQTFAELTLEIERLGTVVLRQTFVDAKVRRAIFNPAGSNNAGETPTESIVIHAASIVIRYSKINDEGGVTENVEETVICAPGS